MKKWLVCFVISVVISIIGLFYFVSFVMQDGCLDSGGSWKGVIDGCDSGNGFTTQYLMSPLSIAIYIGIIFGISGALVQVHKIVDDFKNKKRKHKK